MEQLERHHTVHFVFKNILKILFLRLFVSRELSHLS